MDIGFAHEKEKPEELNSRVDGDEVEFIKMSFARGNLDSAVASSFKRVQPAISRITQKWEFGFQQLSTILVLN